MRVISGTAKGAALFAPIGAATRPTSDFVKENLFNIIQGDVFGSNFLDLFAGTGAVGIEALSRGATSATFVEISEKCINLLKRNLQKTNLHEKANVIKGEMPSALKRLDGQKFDLIFLDPPYSKNLLDVSLAAILEQDVLSQNGRIIIEMARFDPIPQPGELKIQKEKEYGGTRLVILGATPQ